MLIGLLMLLLPIALFLVTFPISKKLNASLCKLYRIVGGIIVIVGSGISLYFAAYTGEQGGVAAFFFQIAVILVYILFSVTLVILNWVLRHKEQA